MQTADIYQIDGSLTAAATMATARSRHTATLLQDGRVLVAGGDSGAGTATNSAEIYDPGSDTWNSVGPLVSARFGHSATLLADGRVAIIGGESNGAPVAGIEVFDPNTGLFTQSAALNVARKDHAAALLADGRVLVAGGFGADAQNNQLALSSVEIFDPVTNAVSAAANLNTARGRHSATVVLDGFVVVAGGSNGQADLNSIEIYTPGTDAWAVSAATLSTARNGHVATLLAKNNSVLISGGSSNGTALQSAEIFQPWTGTVVSAGNMNAARVFGTGLSFGAEGLYLAAGGSDSKTTEFFRFATIKTNKDDYAPGTPVLMSGTGYQPNEVVGLNLKQDDGDADINVSVQADAAGNISYHGFAPDPGDVGTHFHLTAVGQTSGFQAQTVFTDAQHVVILFAGNGSGTVTGSGFNCTDTAGVATGICDVGGFNNKNPINLTAVTGGSIGGWVVTAGDATVTSGCTSGSTTCNLQMGNQATTVTLTINKVSQTITFGALAGKIYGDADFTVSATASSGLAVSFSSQTTGVCTVSASTVHIVAAGGCTIRASQAGDSNHFAAPNVDQSFTVAQKSITATVTANNKIYDATTTATQNACTLSGVLPADSANVTCSAGTLTFADKNVGTAKVVSVSGISLSGTAAANYQLSSTTASASANITARPLTVTATTNTKIYDGGITAVALPAITTGALQGSDTASFTETYDTKNVGTAKTLTPSGTVSDGNNYNVTFAAVSTGIVNKRSLTVSATADNKIYDGTTNATAHLTDDRVTGDALTVAYGTAAFIDKNVGNAKTVNVTGINVTGADSGNYTFNSSATATANITPRDLTVTATADNKIYDRTTNAVAHLADNRISGDILTASYTTAAFADKNVGNGKTVTVSGISISGLDAGNYNLTNAVASALANITARTVTPVIAANNKVYDRLTTATLSSQSVSGFIPPDVVGLTVTAVAFDTKNAGSGKTVTATGLSLNGPDAGNYSLNGVNSATTTADITPRPLNVTATGVDRIYDGTAGASVTLSDDRIAGDILTESYATASFANKNVGNNKPVSVSGIAISGLDAGNYSLNSTSASTTANISPRSLTVSATGVSKVYDGTTAATVTLADDRIAGDLVTDSYASASFTDKNVANGKPVSVSGISISGADAGNYTFNSTASTFANITPRPLHISATGVSRVYDGTTVATVALSDDRVSGDVFSDSYTSASFADKNAANAKPISVIGIAISGPDAGNYSANNSASTIADITARPITVSATSDTKVYDATTSSSHTPAITAGSVAAGDSAAFTQAFDSKNAGARTLIAGGSVNDGNGGNNYSISFATAAGSITQRPLTVTATATGKIYDGTTTASVTLSDNHLGGDSVSDTYASAAFSDKNVGTGKLVSVTGISLSGADSGNYSLTSTTASTTADITARTLTVSAHGIDKPYDGGTAATVTLSDDHVSGDLITDSYTTASFADKNVGVGKPVAVSGISISGADAANYALASTSATTTAAINARSLTVSAAGIGKIYDGTTTGSVTLSDNRIAGDTFTDSYATALFSDRNAGTSKPIAVSGISISGPDAGNYSLANVTATASADISPLGLTVAAVTDSKIYDGTITSTGIPHVTPALVSGDSGIFSQTFNNKNAGNSKLLVPAAAITDGNGGNNYAVSLVNNNTGVITPRGLAVSASASDKVYDGTTTASVSLTDNRLSGDSFNINFAGANFADQNAGLGKIVTVSGISLSGPDGGNYTPNTTATATASILQRPITVTADSKTRIFGTPDPALTYQITSGSLVSGDSFTGNLVRAAGSTVGSYAISQGTLALSSNYMLSFLGSSFTITPAATTITLNPAATITLGQATLPVSATVHAVLPSTALVGEGSVTFTLLQGSTIVASATSATVSGGGAGANLAVSALPVGSYTVQATFNPPTIGANFTGSSSTAGVSASVQYNVCLLYDVTKSVKSGATYPIKVYLCDINNRDVSASGIVIHAISASMLSGWSGPPEDAGNSNPDLDFRYDPTLGPSGGYIFNLKTTGLGSGTYSLNFSAGGDAANHSVPFGVK
ncbi:MAG TPA: YDG domain-containing protein [Candidatus Angelobacter sp.]